MIKYESKILPKFNLIVIEGEDRYYDKFKRLFNEFGIAFVDINEKLIFVDGNYIFENDWFEKKHLDFIEAHEAAHVILGHNNSNGRNIYEERDADYFAIQILEQMGNTNAATVGKDEFLTRNGMLFESATIQISIETKKIIREFFRDEENEMVLMESIVISESRIIDMKAKYPNIPEDVFNYFVDNDPSGNQKYLDWLLSAYQSKKYSKLLIHKTFPETILDLIRRFQKVSPRLTTEFVEGFFNGSWRDQEFKPDERILKNPKDIYSYNPNRITVLSELIKKIEANPTKNEIRDIIRSETDRVMDTDDWTIVKPKTHRASCLYGANTRWCTAEKYNSTHFDNYTNDGELYYVINNKNKKKYAIHVNSVGDIEIFDELDEPQKDILPKEVWGAIITDNQILNGDISDKIISNQDEYIDLDNLIDSYFEDEN